MKRKTWIAVLSLASLLMLLGISIVWLTRANRVKTPDGSISSASAAALTRKEIVVRNVTKETVAYTVKPLISAGVPEKRSLKPGGMDRFAAKRSLVLTYSRLGNEVTETLSPGTPYCFRYDENNLVHLYLGSHMREDAEDLAPYVSTPMEVAEKMLEMAQVGSADVVYDLGCGDGRLVILAAKKFGARGVGVDIVPRRIKEAKAAARKAGVENLVKFSLEDAMKTDFSEATVLALYLLPESNALLRPRFESLLKPGARIVTHDYTIPGWDDKRIASAAIKDPTGKNHTIFLYHR
jgi:predicted O-methyltransferase YrrM